MQAKNVGDQEVGGPPGRGEDGKGNKVSSLGKTVYDRENGGVTVRVGKTSNEVHGDVGPGPSRNGQRMKKTGKGPNGGLVLSTGGAGCDERLGVWNHGGPPEPLA